MARISSYDQDGTLNKLDKVIGTDSITGNTKNYTINSMLQLVNQEGLVEAFDGASFAFVDYIPASENPRGVISLNGGVATQANFSDINQLYISTVDKTGLSINEYLDNSLNNQIKVSLKGNVNQFGIYEVAAISSHDDGAYKILTLTPRAYNGTLTVYEDFFLSNYSAVFDQDFSNNSVTEFGDVSDAGSGEIITDDERESLNNFTNNGLLHSDVVDNVTSTSTDVPLSANQGKVLKDLIDAINTLLTSDNVDLDTLQEVVDYIETNRGTLDSLSISNITGLQDALNSKQNTETGKGLSANDFTDELLSKLNNIAAEAEVNVNADWSSSTGDSEILNKPTDLTNLGIHNVAELSDVTSAGSGAIITGGERIKLNAIDVDLTNRTVTDGTNSITVPPSNAEQNVNADWEATSGDAEILNKPALAPSNAQPNVQSDWSEADAASDAFILNKPTDVTDLTQHNAIDLADIDSIGSGDIITDDERTKLNNIEAGAQVNVQADWSATTGDALILNKPALAPSNAEQNVQADWSETDAALDSFILNKPALAPSNAEQNVNADWNETDSASDSFIQNKPALAPSNAEENVQADWSTTDSALDSFILNKPDIAVTKTKVDTALGTADADDSYFYRGDGTWADPLSDITLGDLTDVRADTTDPGLNEGFVLRWSPTMDKWVGSSYYLEDLDNVATNQSNSVGKVLAVTSFNAQNSVNTYDAVELTINSLGDFNITSPSNNQILQYNDSTSHWENSSDLALPGTLEFTETQSTTPSFDNGIYVSTEDGHDTMHFRYHGHDLSIDYLTQVLPTGILDGGVLSKANNTQFTIAAGDGVINDLNKAANSDPHPEIVKVAWDEQTITVANLDANETDQLNSWIYVDSTGTVRQQTTAFTDAQKKSNIIIGSAIHSEGVLKFVKTFPHTGYNNASQMNEFAGIFGPMKKSGHKITANGANLSIDRAAGVAFALGRNYANDPENPSTISDGAKAQCVIHRYYSDGSNGFILDDGVNGAGYTTLDPTKHDDGTGTLATVSGGHYSVQRLYYFPSTPDIIVAYYGRDEYNAMDLAEKSYNLEDFTEAPNTSDQAIFVGSVILAGGTTDLTGSANAKFLTAGAFRGLAAVTVGGAIAGSSLNDLSDVNLQNLSDAEVLRYNSSTQQFENVSDSVLPITLDNTNNRVGINQTTPTHNLHVVGNAKITGDVALDSNIAATGTVTGSNLNISNWDTAYGWGDHSTAGYLTAHPNITAAGNSSNSGRTYIQSITVDSNGHILSMATGSETVVNTDTIDMGDGFKVQNSGGSDQFTITENDGLRIEGTGATSVSFDSATNKITVDSTNTVTDLTPLTLDSTNNRVGINESNVDARLHISGTSSGLVNQKFESPGSSAWRLGIPAGQTYFAFDDSSDDLSTPEMVITTSGSVGIGTDSPARELEVKGAGNVYIRVTAPTDNDSAAIELKNTQEQWEIRNEDTNDDALHFNNDSGNKMAITKAGNVGIGTTSPVAKLEVNTGSNAAYFTRTAGDNGVTSPVVAIASDSSRGLLAASGASLDFRVRAVGTANPLGGSTKMRIQSNGDVGIGDTSPSSRLQVYDSTEGQYMEIGAGDGGGRSLVFTSSNNNGSAGAKHNINAKSVNGVISFSTGGNERLLISKDGNAGIGTTTPGYKLEVAGKIASNTGFHSKASQGVMLSAGSGADTAVVSNGWSSGVGDWLKLEVPSADDEGGILQLNSNGRVGIGTTSPAVSLDINATDAIALPTGTTAQRPSSPAAGMFRYNTEDNQFEGYTTEWGAIAGSGSGGGSGEIVKETFNGTGSQASFALGDSIADIDNINVYVNGVYQYPSNYTVSGNTVTFASGSIPASGTGNVHVRHNVTAPTLTEGAAFSTSGNLVGDGATQTFSLGGSPRSSDHVMVFLEGVYQEKENYSISGSNITFTTAPPNGYSIEAKYVTGLLDLTSVGEVTLREYVGNGNTATYALGTTPTSEAYVDAYIEGVYQEKGTYNVSGSNIVFDSNIPNGYSIELKTIGTIPVSSVTQTTFVSDEFTANGSTNNFTLVNGTPTSKSLTMVFIQGVYQSKSNYNLVSGEIQFTAGTPDEDDVIEVISMSAINTASSPVTSVNGEVGAVTVASKHNVSVISANTTAVANTLYVFTANLNLTLPASPAMGDSIKISNRSTVDTCQLLRNGNNILGAAADLTLDTASSSFELVYTDTANGWVIIGQ